jgi:hypothetical protein
MASIEERHLLICKAENDPILQKELMELCRRDIVFWFDHFCWTYNPRLKQPHLPFNLYPFQKQIARAMQHCIDTGEGALIEKSRDMGLSWLILLVFQWYWIFMPGADFLLGSKKEKDVDEKGVMSKLFPKLRYNAGMLPVWMLPKLERHHDSFCKLINPVNGNSFVGEAATQDFARSGRYLAILLDEFARHPFGELAYESANHSSNSIFLLFTPYGKANHAYRLSVQEDLKHVPLYVDDTEEEIARSLRIF